MGAYADHTLLADAIAAGGVRLDDLGERAALVLALVTSIVAFWQGRFGRTAAAGRAAPGRFGRRPPAGSGGWLTLTSSQSTFDQFVTTRAAGSAGRSRHPVVLPVARRTARPQHHQPVSTATANGISTAAMTLRRWRETGAAGPCACAWVWPGAWEWSGRGTGWAARGWEASEWVTARSSQERRGPCSARPV